MRPRAAGQHLHDLAQEGFGGAELTELPVHEREPGDDVVLTVAEVDRALERGDRRVQPPEAAQHFAERGVVPRVVGVDRDRSAERGGGLVGPAPLLVDLSEVVPRLPRRRYGRHDRPEHDLGLVELARATERVPQIVVDAGVALVDGKLGRRRAPQQRDGFRVLLVVDRPGREEGPEEMPHLGVFGRDAHRSPVQLFCPGEIARLMELDGPFQQLVDVALSWCTGRNGHRI